MAAYSGASREIISEVYRDDIELIGYTFDNSSLDQQLARHDLDRPDVGSRAWNHRALGQGACLTASDDSSALSRFQADGSGNTLT
jgi:hypothetical protein